MANVDEIARRAKQYESVLRVAKREQYEAAVLKDVVKWGHQRKIRRAARYRLSHAKDALARARRGRARWLRLKRQCTT